MANQNPIMYMDLHGPGYGEGQFQTEYRPDGKILAPKTGLEEKFFTALDRDIKTEINEIEKSLSKTKRDRDFLLNKI